MINSGPNPPTGMERFSNGIKCVCCDEDYHQPDECQAVCIACPDKQCTNGKTCQTKCVDCVPCAVTKTCMQSK